MKFFKNQKFKRILCFYLALNLFFEIVAPTAAFALTSGPTQEEFASFEPASTSDMVDLYSGDFTYNIPLLSIPGPNGGYPVNLAYHSGVGMEQEASWVGLGWTLNVGAINRQLRGLPDDYSGETVTKTQKLKNTFTAQLDFPKVKSGGTNKVIGLPVLGKSSPFGTSLQVYYNNFKGTGFRFSLNARYPSNGHNANAGVGLNIAYDSQNGLDIEPRLSLDLIKKTGDYNKGMGFDVGLSYNSRHGVQNVNFSTRLIANQTRSSIDKLAPGNDSKPAETAKSPAEQAMDKEDAMDADANAPRVQIATRSTSSFASTFNVAATTNQTKTTTVPFTVKIGTKPVSGPWEFASKFPMEWSGYYTQTTLKNSGVQNLSGYGYMYNLDATSDNQMRDFQRDNIPYSKKVPNLPMSNFTYDLFTQTGQGSASMFRSFQNGIGVLSDPEVKSDETTVSVDLEVGFQAFPNPPPTAPTPTPGIDFHLGIDGKYGSGFSRSGNWNSIKNDDYPTDFGYSGLKGSYSSATPEFENNYFQVIGEKAGYYAETTEDQLWQLRSSSAGTTDEAIRLGLSKEKNENGFLNRHYEIANTSATSGNKKYFVTNEGSTSNLQISASTNYYKKQTGRVKRATSIESFTYNKADTKFSYGKYGTNSYQYLDYTPGNNGTATNIQKDALQYDKQIREMSVLQPDGMRYVYGLPVRNSKQVDNVYSITGCSGLSAPQPTIVNQTTVSTTESNLANTCDGYQTKNEYNKPYVNSWLLSYIFSPDYIDRTNDGPTEDDYGYWMKFTYGKYLNTYKWRIPYSGNNFMVGQIGDAADDKASYTYGEKEIYFLEKIETKTHVAVFKKSDRLDSYDANNESTGGLGSSSLKKLDQIVLYTQKDYNTNISNLANATPVKAVNFIYSYDLCPNVENNSQTSQTVTYIDENGNSISRNGNASKGKLTLMQVYFTYQKSNRGSLSPYIFNYGSTSTTGGPVYTDDQNPAYNKMNMDRWGNLAYNVGINGKYNSSGNEYPYAQFPYTSQDPNDYNPPGPCVTSNKLSPAPWSLKKIFLPTGGILKISYDFDDYANVETQRALDMFDITGMGDQIDGNHSRGDRGYTVTNNYNLSGGTTKIYFKLKKACTTAEFKARYIDNLPSGQVYFNVFVKYNQSALAANPQIVTAEDFVNGYAEIDMSQSSNYGVSGTNGYITLKAVPLAKVNLAGNMVSPIYRASIEALQANHPDWLYQNVPHATNASAQISNLFNAIPNLFQDIKTAAKGFNYHADHKKYVGNVGSGTSSGYVLRGYSTIRLCDPDYKKIGGGVRVQKLELDDNWDNDGAGASDKSTYGQTYDYTEALPLKDSNNGDFTITKSTGVAYEPKVGSEESALKTAIKYVNSTPLGSNYHMFVETPVGESYYPGPSVGYSKVTVSSIGPTEANKQSASTVCSAGTINVYEFYTPKDFPVIFKQTDKGPYSQPIKISIPILGLFTSTKRRHAQSQGYTIILNDMAGKPRTISTYTAKFGAAFNDACGQPVIPLTQDKLLSRQQYIYNTVKPYNTNAVNELSSMVQAITVDQNYNLNYQTAVLGQTHDFFLDLNENEQQHESFGVMGNLDFEVFNVGGTPAIPFPFMWMMPSYDVTYNSMRTAVTNKIINRTGILVKTINTIEQSTITTENLAFDIESGEVILSKVSNEFKDPQYTFSYKGHWYYKNLGGSYQNFGIKFSGFSSGANFEITIPSTSGKYFTKGDLVYIDAGGSSGLYHVYRVDNTQANQKIYCIDKNGTYFPSSTSIASLEIVKSGYKNLQQVNSGSLVFKKTETTDNAIVYDFKQLDPTNLYGFTGTLFNAPQYVLFTDAAQNKILNASAVEFSDNWQTLGGRVTYTTTTTPNQCVCTPNQTSIDIVNFMKTLKTNLLLLQTPQSVNGGHLGIGIKVYDSQGGGTFLNGFNANLAGTVHTGMDIYCSTLITLSGDLLVIKYEVPNTDPLPIYNGTYNLTYQLNSFCSPGSYPISCYFKFDLPSGAGASNFNAYVSYWKTVVGNMSTTGMTATPVCTDLYDGVAILSSDPNSNSVAINLHNEPTPCSGINNLIGDPLASGCYQLKSCSTIVGGTTTTTLSVCGRQPGDIVNPYQEGMKGIWRPKYNYAYHSIRKQIHNVRHDGIFEDFQRFPWENPSTRDKKWVRANTISKNLPHDFEVENMDPLGIFSSAVYGYNFTLPVAVAKNARYNEIAYDGFEDYPLNCDDDHFKFTSYQANVTSAEAHTGSYSIYVSNGQKVSLIREMKPLATYLGYDQYTVNNVALVNDGPTAPVAGTNGAHALADKDFLGKFAPIQRKKYVVSVWVKTTSTNYTYTAPKLTVNFNNGGGSVSFTSSGNIIDGWQRIYGEFDTPHNATFITVDLDNATNASTAYYDDIRIHPFDANMESFVYDPISLKPVADLDANNYATFYNYDDEGHLIKVKRETKEGVKTVKEGRNNTRKIQ